MGIGRQQFIAALDAIKLAVSGRNARRRQVAALVTAGQEWLAKFDAQDNAAPADFAASRQSQFNTFVDALPDITIDAADPTEPPVVP
jgi:hypothetical protein